MRLQLPLLVALALGSSACAVLTVDVDVYKGPLANHPDVQVEQLAVMAIGAKPVLVQLQSDLSLAKSPQAKTVEGIVDLYEDAQQVPEPLRSQLSAKIRAGERLMQQAEGLSAGLSDEARDRELLKRCGTSVTESQLRDLEALLLKRQIKESPVARPPERVKRTTSSTVEFEWLTRVDQTRLALKNTLSSLPDAVLDELVARLDQIGSAFLQGRELMDRSLLLALEVLSTVEGQAEFPNQEDLRLAAIEVVSRLIQPKAIYAAMLNQVTPAPFGLSLTGVDRLEAACKKTLDGDRGAIDAAEEEVREFLRKNRVHGAQALRSAHLSLKTAFSDSLASAEDQRQCKEFEDPIRRKYGVARALTVSASETREIEAAFGVFGNLETVLGTGLEHGRLEKGLESRIEDYLRARERLPSDQSVSDEIVQTRRRLLDDLVHFAEKILFLAHQEPIQTGQGDPAGERAQYSMVLESVGNSILTVNDELRHRWSREGDQAKAKLFLEAARAAWPRSPEARFCDLVAVVEGNPVVPDGLLDAERVAVKTVEDEFEAKEKELEQARSRLVSLEGLETAWQHSRVVALIEEWKPADASRLDLWKNLESFLTAKKDETAAQGSAPDVVASLDAVLADLKAAIETEQQTPTAGSSQAAAALAQLKTDRETRLTAERANLTTIEGQLATKKSAVTTERQAYETALDTLKTASSDAVKAVRVAALAGLDENGVELCDVRLRVLAELEKGDDRSKKAAKLLLAQPLASVPDPRFPAEPYSPAQVLDSVIEVLRAARIAGRAKNQALDAQLESALKLAMEDRKRLIYIRPPSSYLRNATPISVLQDNEVGWHNELARLSGRALGLERGDERRARTQALIDRQFWQNINRVRVTGGGNTTYALVKDDIGNWYVKGYVGDPEVVIKGVQGMAMAAFSGRMNADLLQRASDLEAVQKGETPPGPRPTLLGQHLARFTGRYGTTTTKDATELTAATAALADSLKTTWKALAGWKDVARLRGGEEGVLARIDEASRPALVDVPALPKDTAAQPEHCLELLARTATFEEALLVRVAEKELVDPQTAETTRTEAEELAGTVQGLESTLHDAEVRLQALRTLAANDPQNQTLANEIADAERAVTTAEQAVAGRKTELEGKRRMQVEAESRLEADRALVRALRRAVVDTVGGAAERFLDRRRDAVDDYRTALQVLGERPEPAQPEQP